MNKELFLSGLRALGLEGAESAANKFGRYSELLREWNKKINLTAITDDDGITVKHFLDSLLPLKYVDISGGSLADIGTGAGFPGLPIKLARPGVRLTLIDSLKKRINFLSAVCGELGVEADCVHGRAEELGRKELRDSFDTVVSRAVANMTALSEYCMPFVRVGGRFVALKSEGADAEIDAARPIIGTLGGRIAEIVKAPLPESGITRTIVIIEKTKPTPDAFPRGAKKIKQAGKTAAAPKPGTAAE